MAIGSIAWTLTALVGFAAGDPLPRSAPEAQGVSSADLLAFVEAADAEIDGMHSLMVVRHGQVVAEGWWAPFDPETPHVLYSLSKSFTSTAVGIACAEGKLSLDDDVLKFFPEEAPAEPSANLKAMRVRDLLRMNTGHETEPAFWRADGDDSTWVARFLAHPVPFKPGTKFLYNTAATYMLSAIVQEVTGEKVVDYLRPRLFEPLGFADPVWTTSPDGITSGGYGLSARTEEIAKFGQLYLQQGQWRGKQLVPSSYVQLATSLQTSNGSSPTSDWDQGYGFQFWRSRHGAYRGDGAFGQYCVVIPEQDVVIAITSGVGNMQSVLDLVWSKLLPAFRPVPLPEDDEAVSALRSRLEGLELKRPAGSATSPLASSITGKWFTFPANDRQLAALKLDFPDGDATLTTRTADGAETRTPLGFSGWPTPAPGFSNGLSAGLALPRDPLVSASASWESDRVLLIKLALPEAPSGSLLRLEFPESGGLSFSSSHSAFFGPAQPPTLKGTPAAAE
jgi:CubicO group peptidase (beta-lactamase class C family)